jgi:hypothetical protein
LWIEKFGVGKEICSASSSGSGRAGACGPSRTSSRSNDRKSKVRFCERPKSEPDWRYTRDARATQSFCTRLFVARDANPHADCIDQIVADQTGCDCDRKLGSGSRKKPMLLGGSVGVHGVPPAVDKACCDCQHDEEGEPAARSIKKSFRVAFPAGYGQTDQTEKTSNGHTSQGKSQSRPEPEGDQESEAKKESSGETGRPHIRGGDPTPALSSSSAGAVAQSKGKQNHTTESEENKKQQSEKNDRHVRMLARTEGARSTEHGAQGRTSETRVVGLTTVCSVGVQFIEPQHTRRSYVCPYSIPRGGFFG